MGLMLSEIEHGHRGWFPASNGDIERLIDKIDKLFETEKSVYLKSVKMTFDAEWFPLLQTYLRGSTHYVYHVSKITPETPTHEVDGEMWVQGFPHNHNKSLHTVTIVVYLSECEGGELVVWDTTSGEHRHEFMPFPKRAAGIHGNKMHGVKAVTGGVRYAVHCTGYAEGDEGEKAAQVAKQTSRG